MLLKISLYTINAQMKPQPLEEHQIATILLKAVQILDDLHSQGKVHNEVTIANIILSESGEIKLEDCKVPKTVLQMVPEVDQLIEDDQKVLLWNLTQIIILIHNNYYVLACRLISGPLVSQLWR